MTSWVPLSDLLPLSSCQASSNLSLLHQQADSFPMHCLRVSATGHLLGIVVQSVKSCVNSFCQPHGLQHSRLLSPSLSPGVCNSHPLSWWYCLTSVIHQFLLFDFCSFPASGSCSMESAHKHQKLGNKEGVSGSTALLDALILDFT